MCAYRYNCDDCDKNPFKYYIFKDEYGFKQKMCIFRICEKDYCTDSNYFIRNNNMKEMTKEEFIKYKINK